MKCTQYGICGEVAFKNARATAFFWVVGRGGQRVLGGSRKSRSLFGATAHDRIFLPRKARNG